MLQGFHKQSNLPKLLVQLLAKQQQRPWSTMECSQQAAWTMNRSLIMVSHDKPFPGRPTNSSSTVPGVAQMDGDVIGSHQSNTSHSGSAPASPDILPTLLSLSCMHRIHHLHPCPTQSTIAMTNYTHTPTVTNSSAFLAQL